MRFFILLVCFINFLTIANAEVLGHQIDLLVIGDDYLIDILQQGLGNHKLDLILDNANISEIRIIQEGNGPWSIEIDGTAQDWPNAVEVGGICNSMDGCSLILE